MWFTDGAGGIFVDGEGHGFVPETCFESLVRDASAEVYLALALYPRDPATGLTRAVHVTTAPALQTGPEDTPPNVNHLPVIISGWVFGSRLSPPGQILGPSSVSSIAMTWDNSDGRLTELLDLDWSDARVEARLGGQKTASGTAYPYSAYTLRYVATIQDFRDAENSTIAVSIVGRRAALAQQFVEEAFSGYGGAVAVPPGETLSCVLPSVELADTGASFEWIGVLNENTSIGLPFLKLPTWTLRVDPPRYLSVVGSDVGTPSPFLLPLNQRVRLVVAIYPDGSTLDLSIDSGQGLDLVATGNLTTPLTTLSGALSVGGTTGLEAKITPWEIRLWGRYLAPEDLPSYEGPLFDLDDPALVEVWKFEDGTGMVALGSKGFVDLTLSAGASFASSLDGDDPTVFPGGPTGQTKPDGWGACSNVRLINVDTQKEMFLWSRAASDDLLVIRRSGVPMVPDETVTAAVDGDIVFLADGEIIFPALEVDGEFFGLRGHRFVPGQLKPAVAGQSLEVTGSLTCDGVYEIEVDGVQEDGRRILLTTTLPADEVAPAGCAVSSYGPEVQYSYDLATSSAQITGDEAGDLTADVVLRVGQTGSRRLSAAAEYILGGPVDTSSLTFDPEVGLFLPAGGSIPWSTFMDRLAASAFAWWVEKPLGGYRLGTWRLPSGNPKARIDATNIETLRPIESVTPYRNIRVNYLANFTRQEGGALAGAVPRNLRDRYGKEWQTRRRVATKAMRDRYPLSKERPEAFTSYLIHDEDAETFLDLAAPFYMEKHRWFIAEVSGVPLLAIDLDDEIFVQHPDPNLRLEAGALAIVHSVQYDPSKDVCTLEFFL